MSKPPLSSSKDTSPQLVPHSVMTILKLSEISFNNVVKSLTHYEFIFSTLNQNMTQKQAFSSGTDPEFW